MLPRPSPQDPQLGCFKPSGTALPSRRLLSIAAICIRARRAVLRGRPVLADGRRCSWSVDDALQIYSLKLRASGRYVYIDTAAKIILFIYTYIYINT